LARRPTIADIAKEAGVSKVAVSYALNGRPGVSDDTRRRIAAIAQQLGWAPSSAARALSDGKAGAIGIVVDRPAEVLGVEPFFMRLMAGIQNGLGEGPTALVMQVSPNRAVELDIYRRWHAERRVDGVLLVDLRVEDARLELVTEIGLPAVVIGGPLGRADLPCAWTDDAAGMTDVLDYLAALGHRRVVHIAGPAEFVHTRVRAEAFAAATARLGMTESRTVHTDYSDEGGASAARRALVAERPPTALVFDNDVMATAALGVAQELGLAVPGDLSLVAWDDSVLCRLVRPALSALRRPVVDYGELAVSMLLRLLDGEVVEDQAAAQPTLVVRGSTGPPPTGR
jgi:DNA-binding LacI/PurR family transcriptional regulator